MGVEIIQECTNVDVVNGICLEYSYSGHLDTNVSIPMLEAMGLILLWIVVAYSIATIFKKFS